VSAEISPEEYASYVNASRTGAPVSPEAPFLAIPGARAIVRSHGGHLLLGSLTGHISGAPTPVFYAGLPKDAPPDAIVPRSAKLRASHVMSPVGPFDGLGGQHGPLRHSKWLLMSIGAASQYEASLSMQALVPEEQPRVTREFTLRRSELKVATTVVNTGDEDIHTSLGHHDYYVTPHNQAMTPEGTGPLVNGLPLDRRLHRESAWRDARTGKAQLWPQYSGSAFVQFPGGNELLIRSELKVDGEDRTGLLGMQFWGAKDEPDYIAAEVVAGVVPEHQAPEDMANRQLYLAAGATATLTVTTLLH
jgi:hypothetical protein